MRPLNSRYDFVHSVAHNYDDDDHTTLEPAVEPDIMARSIAACKTSAKNRNARSAYPKAVQP
jgi:hypothetical protein